jgi:hypothetical protein
VNENDLLKIATYNQLTTQHLLQVNLAILRNQILSARKYDDRRHLLRYGFRLYSKSEQDGIIQEIFNRIGIKHHRFVEIGAECGIECSTAKLLIEGWRGTWVEANPQSIDRMKRHFQPFIKDLKLIPSRLFVTADNANELVDPETDILVIDIDYNDYWIWQAIEARPRVVVIEYNAAYPPPMSVVTSYDLLAKWDGTNYFGASLEALVRLGQRKGYQLVGCDISGSDAFFVVEEEAKKHFCIPATSEALYEPQRAYFSLGQYNPPSPRPFVMVEK